MSNEFSVYWWDDDDGQYEELRYVSPALAMRAFARLTKGPGAVLGLIKRVIITDGGDCCVFEWKRGEGVTFPKPDNQRRTA